jgi:hypothetical protein
MQTYDLPIHFGNTKGMHEIDSESLIVFINAYKEIFEELTNSKISIEIGVPAEGGWKTNLAIVGTAISFIGIDNLSILLRGKPSGDLFYTANTLIKEFLTQKADETPETYPRKCIEHKNKVYLQFQKDTCIDSFDLGNSHEIPKRDFDLYIKTIDDDESEYLGEANIEVSSPDWKGKRSWRGKIDIVGDTENTFDFDKDLTGKFWESVKLDTLPLHTQDTMSVQLLKRPTTKVKYRVIRVLNYNNTNIDTALSDQDISKIAVKISKIAVKRRVMASIPVQDEQLPLFPNITGGINEK